MSPFAGLKTGVWGEANAIGMDWKVLLVLEDVAEVTLEEDVLVELEHELGVCVILEMTVAVVDWVDLMTVPELLGELAMKVTVVV
jgi:hypothetical protein